MRRLGKHLVDVIDPDAADARLAKELEADELKAARKTDLQLWEDGEGGWDGRFHLPGLPGDQLQRLLHAFTSPDRREGGISFEDEGGRKRPTSERLGEAFEQLIARYPLRRAPKLRGRNATVVVTMTLETLMGGLAAAKVDTGRLLSPGAARSLAADAGVIPAVLDGDGAVLDLGPDVRFFTGRQRVAMAVQQGGLCAVEGCDRPAWWCDGAHLIPNFTGGPTSVEDGALICPRHHQLADSAKYEIERIRPGRIRIIRRQ